VSSYKCSLPLDQIGKPYAQSRDMLRRSTPRAVQNNLKAAEGGAAEASETEVLHLMRRHGVFRSDGGGRPVSTKWLAAAMAAMKLLPIGVPPTNQLAQLRVVLAGKSIGAWLDERGLDGRQTRQLLLWMRRLASIQSEATAFRVVVEWANCRTEDTSWKEQALRAFLARQLAATCADARSAAEQAWPWRELLAMPQDWRLLWNQVVVRAHGEATRRNTVAAEKSRDDVYAAALRALGGGDPARFWRAVGAAIAARDSGVRSLRVPNRLIEDTIAAAVEPPSRSHRERKRPKVPARWDALLSQLRCACGEERVHVFRAFRSLLAQYDGWK
jgi:hypothetical protein